MDKVIGSNLVRFEEINLRSKEGAKIGHAAVGKIEETLGFPWWLVHRHHLHNGLVEVARRNGVDIRIASRVCEITQTAQDQVMVKTEDGRSYTFDLLVGSDGVQSVVRKTLHPEVKPRPPTGNCAYRAIVPFEEIRKDDIARELVEDEHGALTKMEVWTAPTGYIIVYPISGGKDFNMVLSHFRDPPVDTVADVDLEEVKREHEAYDPRIRRVIEKIDNQVSRWPLLVTGPLSSWSNPDKNIVLIGDAAHSKVPTPRYSIEAVTNCAIGMTNHMAQGAATSMEDGVFLARCLKLVFSGRASVADAIDIYERGRMPFASYKQQLSFLNGWIWQLPEGPAQQSRDRAMEPELKGEMPIRSSNLYNDPMTVLQCYGYDAEGHAEEVIAAWLNQGRSPRDAVTAVAKPQADQTANWFFGQKFGIDSKL